MRGRHLSFLVPFGALAFAFVASCSSKSGIACSSVNPDASAASFTTPASTCYPDNDGINGGSYTIQVAVNDTGFTSTGSDEYDGGTAKNIIATENDAMVTLTLMNTGTMPHGFEVGCTSVCLAYPTLPAGCSPNACFPASSTIQSLMPGQSMTITFDTPTPDGLLYPFFSPVPADANVAGLNEGQWILM